MATSGPTTQLPGHRDLAPLGRGGYSEVYRAYQEQFDRWVAVKVLTFALTDDRSQRRFLRECRLAGRLSSHPNIVTVYDAGISPDGRPYISMELYPDGSLTDGLARHGAFDVADALRIGIALAGALESAHRAGVVHRDVKPGNVLLASYGQPVLTDFGLSVVAEHHEVSVASDALTPYHAAPEVLERTAVTATADVYSLASTVYAMLAGRAAHQSDGNDSIASLLLRILQQDVPPLSRPDIPASLTASLQKAMARDPSLRTPAAMTFALALQEAQQELGLEVTQPVIMDIPNAAPEAPFDPPAGPAAISTPLVNIQPGAKLSTSGPWSPSPAPLWDPTGAGSPLASRTPSEGAPGAAQPPHQAPPAHQAPQAPGSAAPPPAPPSAGPPPPAVPAPQDRGSPPQAPASPGVPPLAPLVPPGASSADLSPAGWGPPPSGPGDETVPRPRADLPHPGATPASPAANGAAAPPLSHAGGQHGAMHDGAGSAYGSPFASSGIGDATVHRDQLPKAAPPAPLKADEPERSRWPIVLGLVAVVVLLVGAGAALLLTRSSDEPNPRQQPARSTGDVVIPEGLRTAESEAGVQLDWEGEQGANYVVLVLSDDEPPVPREATGPSALIPATELRPDVGYCFAVASAEALAGARQPADAFSPPACIRGASEDTVRH